MTEMWKVVALTSVLTLFGGSINGQEPSIPNDLLQDLTRDLSTIYEIQQEIATDNDNTGINFLEVTRESANLFSGASNNSETKGFIPAGSELRVIDQAGDWYAVSLGSGTSAWINAADVVPVTALGFSLQGIGEIPSGELMKEIPSDELMNFAEARDLGWVETKIQELLRSAGDMRDRYRNNAHIEVTGFSLVVGFPPSMSVDFDFK